MALIGFNPVTGGSQGAGGNDEGAYSIAALFPSPESRIPVGRPGTLRRLVCRVTANTLNGPFVLRVLKNGVATAMLVTYLAAETGFKSIDVSVPMVATDEVSFQEDATGAGIGSVSFSSSVEFVPS